MFRFIRGICLINKEKRLLGSKEFKPTDNSQNQKKEIRKRLGLSTNNPINYSKNEEHNYIPPNRFYTEKEEVIPRSY